jgi:hypothetical protein
MATSLMLAMDCNALSMPMSFITFESVNRHIHRNAANLAKSSVPAYKVSICQNSAHFFPAAERAAAPAGLKSTPFLLIHRRRRLSR